MNSLSEYCLICFKALWKKFLTYFYLKNTNKSPDNTKTLTETSLAEEGS